MPTGQIREPNRQTSNLRTMTNKLVLSDQQQKVSKYCTHQCRHVSVTQHTRRRSNPPGSHIWVSSRVPYSLWMHLPARNPAVTTLTLTVTLTMRSVQWFLLFLTLIIYYHYMTTAVHYITLHYIKSYLECPKSLGPIEHYTVVQKNAPTSADYNYDPVQSILIIFSKLFVNDHKSCLVVKFFHLTAHMLPIYLVKHNALFCTNYTA